MVKLADSGERGNVDLFVSDVAGGGKYGGSPSDAMVSAFGKVAKSRVKQPGARLSYIYIRCRSVNTVTFVL